MNPDIVLGPPGTGKTTRLLGMVEESLARGVEPDRIGYVSFTKKAAQEAIDRATKQFGLTREDLRYFRTLHSMCFQVLGLSNGDVFQGKKTVEFGHWIGEELSEMRWSDDGTFSGFTKADRALFMENLARVRCVELRDQYDMYHDQLAWDFVERMSRGLAQYKMDTHLIDYTDMLDLFVRSEWTPPLRELYVDEAQDLSRLQWQVVEKLASTCERVVVAGDDDQAIYRWAGADVEHFVSMPGQVSVLGRSWRCPAPIQKVSDRIIGRVSHRRPKEWLPRDGEGHVEWVRGFDDVDLWGPDVLVLARNAYLIRDMMEGIRSDGIIYEWKGGSSLSRPILEAVRVWESLRAGRQASADEVRRAYEYLSSGVGVARGHKTLPGLGGDVMLGMQDLVDSHGLRTTDIWHQSMDRIPIQEKIYLMRARQKGETTTGKPRVRLSTIHGAKGGEAEHVVLVTDMANRTHAEMLVSPEDEARVWYVAATRAKLRLTIVEPSSRLWYDV